MCCFLACCTMALDFIQKLLTVFLATMICLVVALGLVTAVAAGVAYGYNYSMSEFLTYKRQNVSIYLRQGQFHGQPQFSRDRPYNSLKRSHGDKSSKNKIEGDSKATNPEGDSNAPTLEGDSNAPILEGDSNAPTLEDDSSASTPEGDYNIPTPEGDSSAPTPEGDSSAPDEDLSLLRKSNDNINSITLDNVLFSDLSGGFTTTKPIVTAITRVYEHNSQTWPWMRELLIKQQNNSRKKLLPEEVVPTSLTMPESLIEDIMRKITKSTEGSTVTMTIDLDLLGSSLEELPDSNQVVNTSPKSELFSKSAVNVDKKWRDKIKIKVSDNYDNANENLERTNDFYPDTVQVQARYTDFLKQPLINELVKTLPITRIPDFTKGQKMNNPNLQHNIHPMRYWASQQTVSDDDFTKDEYEEEYNFKPV